MPQKEAPSLRTRGRGREGAKGAIGEGSLATELKRVAGGHGECQCARTCLATVQLARARDGLELALGALGSPSRVCARQIREDCLIKTGDARRTLGPTDGLSATLWGRGRPSGTVVRSAVARGGQRGYWAGMEGAGEEPGEQLGRRARL